MIIIHMKKLKSFNQFLLQYGKSFALIFYIFFTILLISSILELVTFIMRASLQSFLFTGLYIGELLVVFYYLKKRKLYIPLILVIILPLTSWIFIDFVSFISPLVTIPTYGVISLYCLATGGLATYMFAKIRKSPLKYFGAAITGSTILSIVSAFLSVATMIAQKLTQAFKVLDVPFSSPSFMGGFPQIAHPNLIFILAFLFFNFSFVYSYLKKENRELRFFILYLIPVSIYILSVGLIKFYLSTLLG